VKKKLLLLLITIIQLDAVIRINNRSEMTLVLTYFNAQVQQEQKKAIAPREIVIIEDEQIIAVNQKLHMEVTSCAFDTDRDYISICNKTPMRFRCVAHDIKKRHIRDLASENLEAHSTYNIFNLKYFLCRKNCLDNKGRTVEFFDFSGGSITLTRSDQ